MQQVVIPQERNPERIMDPQDMRGIEIEYVAPAPAAACAAPTPVSQHVAPADLSRMNKEQLTVAAAAAAASMTAELAEADAASTKCWRSMQPWRTSRECQDHPMRSQRVRPIVTIAAPNRQCRTR